MRLACLLSPSVCSSGHQALFNIASRFSPRVDEGDPGVFFLDLLGDKKELFFGESLIRTARQAGLAAQVGIAGGKFAARIAAELPAENVVIIRPGEENSFLSPLPLLRLHLPEDLQKKLEMWGVRTIGEFAALPPLNS